MNYIGAGTIEFLVDKHRNYYFLEMNTRLQVEHPITEEVIGVDLVKEQIKVADGQVLQLKQEDIRQRGHAIECRICAEDTEMNFMPSPGIIKQITEPNSIGVRIDSYVYEGYEIPIYYDPMIGKLIVWATNREYAIERMRRVLHEYKLTGVKNNISYLRAIMDTPDFVEGHQERRISATTHHAHQRTFRKYCFDCRLYGLPDEPRREQQRYGYRQPSYQQMERVRTAQGSVENLILTKRIQLWKFI